jgi:hypothetical protein
MEAGAPALLVRAKPGEVVRASAVAVTEYRPATVLAVNTGEVAKPEALVMAVFPEQAKAPLAPVVGTSNVTVTPDTGLPPESFTVAASGSAKGFATTAVCGVPLVVMIDAGTCGSETVIITGTVNVKVLEGYSVRMTSPV